MKKKINVSDYAGRITEALPKGILLCTNGEKFNAMTLGWGGIGTNWSIPVFTVMISRLRTANSWQIFSSCRYSRQSQKISESRFSRKAGRIPQPVALECWQ